MIRYYMVMERLVGVDLEHVLSGMTYDKSGIAVMYAQEIYQMYNSDKKSAVITIMNGLDCVHCMLMDISIETLIPVIL